MGYDMISAMKFKKNETTKIHAIEVFDFKNLRKQSDLLGH